MFEYHSGVSDVRKAFKKYLWDWDDYYSFTSIRNPWAKEVSLYQYARPDIGFKSFWEDGYEPWRGLIKFDQWFDQRKEHGKSLTPISHYAFENGKQVVNEILLLERFEDDIPRLFKRLELPKPTVIRKNKSNIKTNYRDWYNDRLRQEIEKLYEHDIEVGGYTFEGGFRTSAA